MQTDLLGLCEFFFFCLSTRLQCSKSYNYDPVDTNNKASKSSLGGLNFYECFLVLLLLLPIILLQMKLRLTTLLLRWMNLNPTVVNLEKGNSMIVGQTISCIRRIRCWNCLSVSVISYDGRCLSICSMSMPVILYVLCFKSCRLSRLMILL